MKYVLLLLLAGCVATPKELTETGVRSSHPLARATDQAAGCIARNIENARHYQTTTRAIDSGLELVVRSDVHNLAVVQIEPGRASVWTRTLFMGREEFVRSAVQGC